MLGERAQGPERPWGGGCPEVGGRLGSGWTMVRCILSSQHGDSGGKSPWLQLGSRGLCARGWTLGRGGAFKRWGQVGVFKSGVHALLGLSLFLCLCGFLPMK